MTDSIRLDMTIRGVGRLALATGTRKPEIAKKIRRTVEKLLEDGRLDLLLALKARRISPMQLHDLYQRKMLHTIPSAEAALSLTETWAHWIEHKDCSDAHKRSLAQSLRHLAPDERAMIHDLPALVERAKAKLRDKPASARMTIMGARAFAKHELKRSHPIYVALTDITIAQVVPQREKHPLTVADLRALRENLPPHLAEMAWTMAVTGMRVNEFYGKWHQWGDHGVRIFGTKTAGSNRLVPYVPPLHSPVVQYKAYRGALAKAGGITPYDLRRTFANFMEAAHIPRIRRRAYLGHGVSDTTDLYEQHEVDDHLEGDGELLRQHVECAR